MLWRALPRAIVFLNRGEKRGTVWDFRNLSVFALPLSLFFFTFSQTKQAEPIFVFFTGCLIPIQGW